MAARRERYRGQQPAPAAQSADEQAPSANVSTGPDPDPDQDQAASDEDGAPSNADDDGQDDGVAVAAPEDADFDEVDALDDDLEDDQFDDEAEDETEEAPQELYDAEIVEDDPATAGGSADAEPDEEDDEVVGPLSLADELGVQELGDIVFVDQGRLFSAAGRTAPIVELTDDDDLLIRPPEKPLSDDGPIESIEIREDDRGILLNELGERRKILGVKFRGNALYYLGAKAPEGTQRHYVGFFDSSGNVCRLYLQGRIVTTDIVYKLRVRTHDGELGVFPELTDDPDYVPAATAAPDAPTA